MLKIGIVGMGGMGWFHAARYLQLPDAALVAVADIVPERLEPRGAVQINLERGESSFDFSQVARYAEAGQLITEADVDVVDICLPTYLHAPYAIAALEAGRHVLCEKPMALNVADADRMVAAAQQAGRLLMIAQCIRFWPEYLFLRRCVDEGMYGRLLSLNMWRMSGRPGWSVDNWFLDPARSGGMLLDLHIHDVDYVGSVFGMPDSLDVVGRMSAGAKTYDVIHANFVYKDGPQMHIHAGWSAAQIPFQAGFEAWFDRGFMVYDEGVLQVYDDMEKVDARPVDYERGDAYLNEIAYFLKCVETNTQPARCMPASTRDSIALIEREIQNIKERQ